MFNPLLDRAGVELFGATVAAGWISYLSIVARFLLTTAAALALVGTTGMHGVCAALERMFVPDVFVVQLLFLYRYIFVLAEEGMRMSRARDLRSFGRRGRGLAVFGNILGHLLLRTFARAQRIHSAMQLRGFDGHVRSRRALRFGGRDAAFLAVWSALFVTLRLFDLPELLGRLIVGAVS
jgi:cobalt/nickel transport system permease protein